MEFSRRKLTADAAKSLHPRALREVKPYVLLFAPAYVYMELNEKFVAVKAPLDFFSPEDLKRLAPFSRIHLGGSIVAIDAFVEAARKARELLNWHRKPARGAKDAEFEDPEQIPAPYELSDAVLRVTGAIWGPGAVIEPFFVAAFVEELCGALPAALLSAARDSDIGRYESAILGAAWRTFLALHLGYCDLEFLRALRLRSFEEISTGVVALRARTEIEDIASIATSSLAGNETGRLQSDFFAKRGERVCRKLTSRLERVKKELIGEGAVLTSIRGGDGFVDV